MIAIIKISTELHLCILNGRLFQPRFAFALISIEPGILSALGGRSLTDGPQEPVPTGISFTNIILTKKLDHFRYMRVM